MKKFVLGVLAGVSALWALIHFMPLPIGNIRFDHDGEDDLPINEQEEARQYDEEIGADHATVDLKPIHLGDLSVTCPLCDVEVDLIQVGLTSIEDRNTDEVSEFNDITQIGVVYYLCGHVVYSPCLVDWVVSVLNAEEIGILGPELFVDIHLCAEHGDSEHAD